MSATAWKHANLSFCRRFSHQIPLPMRMCCYRASRLQRKAGTFTNTERRIQRVRKAIEPIGEALPDWQIICDVAEADPGSQRT